MINKDNKPIDTTKKRARGGKVFGNSQRVIGGVIATSREGTRVEMDGKNNILVIYVDNEPTISLEEGQITFNVSDGSLAGDISAIGDAEDTNLVINALGSFLQIVGHAVPSATASFDLGASTRRWSTIYSVNALNTSSDKRKKKDIEPLKYSLDTIKKLKPVSFKRLDEEQVRLGFLAQDVEEVLPEVVSKNEDGEYGLSQTDIIPVLVKGIQDLSKEVERLSKLLGVGNEDNVGSETLKSRNRFVRRDRTPKKFNLRKREIGLLRTPKNLDRRNDEGKEENSRNKR